MNVSEPNPEVDEWMLNDPNAGVVPGGGGHHEDRS